LIRDHVLLRAATDIERAGDGLRPRLTAEALTNVLDLVPDALLRDPVIAADFNDAAAARRRYYDYFVQRLAASDRFTNEAVSAREIRLHEPVVRRKARR
jgi:hypothetical protein